MVSSLTEMFVVIELGLLCIVLACISGQIKRLIEAQWVMVSQLDKISAVMHRLIADLTIHARMLAAARRSDGMYGPLPPHSNAYGPGPDYPRRKPDAENSG